MPEESQPVLPEFDLFEKQHSLQPDPQ